jgi:hypothetical protein
MHHVTVHARVYQRTPDSTCPAQQPTSNAEPAPARQLTYCLTAHVSISPLRQYQRTHAVYSMRPSRTFTSSRPAICLGSSYYPTGGQLISTCTGALSAWIRSISPQVAHQLMHGPAAHARGPYMYISPRMRTISAAHPLTPDISPSAQ